MLDPQLLEPVTGQHVSLRQVADGAQALLVMWWCNHCPFVKHLKGASGSQVASSSAHQGPGMPSCELDNRTPIQLT